LLDLQAAHWRKPRKRTEPPRSFGNSIVPSYFVGGPKIEVTPVPNAKKLPSPMPIAQDLLWGGWSALAAGAAVELDLFTTIHRGKTTAAEIAAEAKTHEPSTRRLLDAMVALKYLTRRKDRYGLTPATATFLVRSSDLYMEGAAKFASDHLMGWPELAQAVRTGAPVTTDEPGARGEFFAMLVRCIFPPGYVAATAAVNSLDRATRARIRKILDIAGGAGAWSIPFVQAIKGARATVLDLPQVIPVASEYTVKFGVADRFDYMESDLHQVDLDDGGYDLITLGHVIHTEGRQDGVKLIERCFRALADRGMLLIGEFVPNNDRSGPAIPVLFGLNMMLHTPVGDVFTMQDYREWLRRAGFRAAIKTIRTPLAVSPLILARK
jgi:ubiquinone/menaquinone biosynthesis C-methylase UbiE